MITMRVNIPGAMPGGPVADNSAKLAQLADHARAIKPDADELMVFQGGQHVATINLKE